MVVALVTIVAGPTKAWSVPTLQAVSTVASTIAIRITFNITGNDQVDFPAFFRIEKAPEPTSAVLIGIGLAALATLRRSRG